MSSTESTKLSELSPRLKDRYGYRRTPRWAIGLSAILCISLGIFGGVTANRVANPDIRWKLLAWNAVDAQHSTVSFEIRRAASTTAECVVRAQDKYRQDVGYANITIPPGPEYSQETYPLATRSLAFTVEVLGCDTPGNLYVVPGQFPPGTSNPPQPWRPS
ncbi:MAG: hypothetical protein ACJAY5_000343 [Actinomycetes bacterium]|jgi:hypothetical protein